MVAERQLFPDRIYGPRHSTGLVLELMRREEQSDCIAMDVKGKDHGRMVALPSSGIFKHIDEVDLEDAKLVLAVPNVYDLIVAVDKNMFVEMPWHEKGDLIERMMDATKPGGRITIEFYVSLPNADGKVVELGFEKGIRAMFDDMGWLVSHHSTHDGEKMAAKEGNFHRHPIDYHEVEYSYLIAQKPLEEPLRLVLRDTAELPS